MVCFCYQHHARGTVVRNGRTVLSAAIAVFTVGLAVADEYGKSSERIEQDLRIGRWFKRADRSGIDCSWEFGKTGRLEIEIGGELTYWGTYRFTDDNSVVIIIIWSGNHSMSRED